MPTPVIGVSPLFTDLLFSSMRLLEASWAFARAHFLQRLFSIFPNGWPGRGLLLLRCVAASLLIHDGIVALFDTPPVGIIIFDVIAVGTGLLLLAGLWTPLAGLLVVVPELA